MSVNGFSPLQIESFGGLYTNVVTPDDAPILSSRRSGNGAAIIPSALDAKDIRYIPGGFLSRPGLTSAFTFVGNRKATHIAQLITQQDVRKFLVVGDDGSLHLEPNSGSVFTVLKENWAPPTAIGHSATLFDREHLAASDGKIGTGVPLLWDGTNLDRMSPSGPGTSHTLAAGAAGVVTNGVHGAVIIYETRHGYRPAPNEPVEITIAGNTKIVVSNIPLGPEWIKRRIVALTTAGGASYFFTDETVIDNNTDTSVTIDLPDATIAAGTLVDKLFRRVQLPDCAGFRTYGTRLVAWGARQPIPIENMDFDGGFDPATPTVPAGWATGPANPPASQGPNNPATAAGWSSPTNVFTSNDLYATVFIAGGATSTNIDITNFSFAIPAGATINGITVKIEKNKQLAGPREAVIVDSTVQLLKAGAPVGSNFAKAEDWTEFDDIRTYGGSSNLWGTTWTEAEVEASNFGVRIAAKETAGDSGTARIDHVTITISYTESGGGGSAGGTQEEGDTYMGFSYKITGDGVNDVRGDITQSFTEAFAKTFLPPERSIKFRIRAKRSSGLTGGALRISLDNTGGDFLITAAQLTTTFAIYESAAINIESFPTEIRVRSDTDGSNPLNSGEFIVVGTMEVALADEDAQPSVVFVSEPSDPEAYDGVKGFFQVSPDDGQKVSNCFKFRDLFFVAKERSLHVTRDDGVNPPALWEVKFVDNIGCDSVHGAAVAGEQFAAISYRAGVYAIFGLRPEKISQEIQQSPTGFPSWDDREEPQAFRNHVIIDSESKEVYLSTVRSGGTWPTRTFVVNYWTGWEQNQRRWSYYDWNLPGVTPVNSISASALVEEASAQSIFFGTEEVFRHTGTSDDGNTIAYSWRSAFLGYQGSYGDNLFGALSLHGLTSGMDLVIEAFEIDETIRTISQGGGEQITAARYLELQTNLINEKLSYRLRSNTLDATLKVDAMTVFGKPWYPTRGM